MTQSRKPEATVTAPRQAQEWSWGAAHSTGNAGDRGDQRKPCRHLAVTAPRPRLTAARAPYLCSDTGAGRLPALCSRWAPRPGWWWRRQRTGAAHGGEEGGEQATRALLAPLPHQSPPPHTTAVLSMPRALCTEMPRLTFTMTLRDLQAPFTAEETEALRRGVTGPRSRRQDGAQQGLEPGSSILPPQARSSPSSHPGAASPHPG